MPVGLIDLGPTLLEVFGLPIPAEFQGESLWPLLRGEPAHLTRPRVVDSGRRMQAMYFDDGLKIQRDLRLKRVELYDLRRDPGENKNLDNRRLAAHRRRLSHLGAFFDAHTLTLPGYETPYRP